METEKWHLVCITEPYQQQCCHRFTQYKHVSKSSSLRKIHSFQTVQLIPLGIEHLVKNMENKSLCTTDSCYSRFSIFHGTVTSPHSCICMHIQTQAHTHAHTHTHTYPHTHTHTYAHTHTNTHKHTHSTSEINCPNSQLTVFPRVWQ